MYSSHLILVGFGVVGQGFTRLLADKQAYLQERYTADLRLVGVANARHGLIYDEAGLHLPTLLELASAKRPLIDYPGAQHYSTALDGILTIDADVLVEASPTNLRDAQPALSHIRTALARNMHVVTANKGPGALAAGELFALAREHGVSLRMESAVMAGTPVLSTIREGMAGASITAVRGILNGTTNYILTAMSSGQSYADALSDAQAKGYAETDPTADVEGFDAVAKTMILANLIFGQQLKVEDVWRKGIPHIAQSEVQAASDAGQRMKLIASLRRYARQDGQPATLEASVQPVALPLSDPLAGVDGAMNALSIEADTLSSVTIIGPGAGGIETAQGLLADALACIGAI
ncbi:MAG TPA: homoserine dehydrogenase [Ktedonobacteraceae bacterium]|nr:homoserine dehydrogenase [Ktedonobacteraceae bacterium]